jgi:hypothetical protein
LRRRRRPPPPFPKSSYALLCSYRWVYCRCSRSRLVRPWVSEIARGWCEILERTAIEVWRCANHRRRIWRHRGFYRLRRRLRRPGLMKALGRLWPAGRLYLQSTVAGHLAQARKIMTDMGFGIDETTAIHRGLDMDALGKAPVPLDDGIGGINAVDDDGHAGPAWNHNDGAAAPGAGSPRRPHQNGQCKTSAHYSKIQKLATSYSKGASQRVKGIGKPATRLTTRPSRFVNCKR